MKFWNDMQKATGDSADKILMLGNTKSGLPEHLDVKTFVANIRPLLESGDQIIPYSPGGNAATHSASGWSRYEKQGAIAGMYITKVVIDALSDGKVGIFSGDDKGRVQSWTKLVDVKEGRNDIMIKKMLPKNELLHFGGEGSTSKLVYFNNSAPNTIGGSCIYNGQPYAFDLGVGVYIGEGGSSDPNPLPSLTEIEKWRKMEMDICKYFAIPCIDITYTSQISKFSIPALAPDGGHPNEAGHDMLATAIYPTFSGFLASVPAGSTYYSLGDSITRGYGATYSYAKLLADTAGYVRINKSVPNTTIIGNALYDQVMDIPEGFKGVVTLMMGVNDFTNGKKRGDVEAVLAKDFASLDRTASSAESLRFCLETLKRRSPNCKVLVIVPFFTTWG